MKPASSRNRLELCLFRVATTCLRYNEVLGARWCTSVSSTTSWWTSAGAELRRFLDTVLGPNDDITLFNT
jgi:hypothetical protein